MRTPGHTGCNDTNRGHSYSKNRGAGRFTHPGSIWMRGANLTPYYVLENLKPPPPFDHGAVSLEAPGTWDWCNLPPLVTSVDTIRTVAYSLPWQPFVQGKSFSLLSLPKQWLRWFRTGGAAGQSLKIGYISALNTACQPSPFLVLDLHGDTRQREIFSTRYVGKCPRMTSIEKRGVFPCICAYYQFLVEVACSRHFPSSSHS